MKKLDVKIWHGVFTYNTYDVIAQEVEAQNPLYRRWAAIYIMENIRHRKDLQEIIVKGINHKFLLVIIDISLDFLHSHAAGYDIDIHIARDTQLIHSCGFDDEEALYRICDELKLDPQRFTTSWRANYMLE